MNAFIGFNYLKMHIKHSVVINGKTNYYKPLKKYCGSYYYRGKNRRLAKSIIYSQLNPLPVFKVQELRYGYIAFGQVGEITEVKTIRI